MQSDITRVKLVFLIGLAIFTSLIVTSLILQLLNEFSHIENEAKVQADAKLNNDFLYRKWAAMHGGVYVPVTDQTPVNENLSHIPHRDIVRDDSVRLTLVNPAYMTRQVHELGNQLDLIKGHITSLDPLRKENKADEWETAALVAFEKGVEDTFSLKTIDGKPHYRYMKPLVTEQACLKCHEHQGYQLGDIRGGLSVSVPAEPYIELAKEISYIIIFTHLVIFAVVLLFGFLSYRAIKVRLSESFEYRNKLHKQGIELIKKNEELLKQKDEYKGLAENYLQQNVQLEKAKHKAEENEKLKTSFLNNMSHEIRTPMNGIMGFSQLLEGESLSDDKRSYYLDIIKSSCSQLLDIVNDILEISKIETGQLELNYAPVSISAIISDLKDKWSEKDGYVLHTEFSIELENIWFKADERLLFRMIDNFISNAFKFSENHPVILRCTVIDEELKISVKDSGIGIAGSMQKAIFDRFRKVEIGESYMFGGTGLGLSLCMGYADILHGEIVVDSELEHGATFSYIQPIEIVDTPDLSFAEDITEPVERKLHLLIVDDELINYQYLKEVAEHEGYITEWAKNGQEAVDAVEHNVFDAILMDLKMPVLDGFKASEQIHKLHPETPIIAQTAFVSSEEVDRARNAGCMDIIFKPVNQKDLTKKLHSAIVHS